MRLFKSTAPALCARLSRQCGILTIPSHLRSLKIKTDKENPRTEETVWKIIAEFPRELTCRQTKEAITLEEFIDIQPEIQRLEKIIQGKNPAVLKQIAQLKHLVNPQFLAILDILNKIAKGKMIKNIGTLADVVSPDFIQSLQSFSDVIPPEIPALLNELQEIDPTALFGPLDKLQDALNNMEFSTDAHKSYKKLPTKQVPEIDDYLALQSLQEAGFHHAIEYPVARFYQAKLISDEERDKAREYILVCLNTLRTRAENTSSIQKQIPHG